MLLFLKHPLKKQLGSSLIEVLVSVVIMSIGLLGLAALQTTAMKNNVSALKRTQASVLAYEFIDLMRANIDMTNPLSPVIPLAFTSYDSEDNSENGSEDGDCLVVGTSCDSGDMADNDLFIWTNNLKNYLSSTATAEITGSYTLTINWEDYETQSGSDTRTFTTDFKL